MIIHIDDHILLIIARYQMLHSMSLSVKLHINTIIVFLDIQLNYFLQREHLERFSRAVHVMSFQASKITILNLLSILAAS